MITLICTNCSKQYARRQRGSKFCSHECYSKNKIGTRHSHGEKISAALKGRVRSQEHIAKLVAANKGKERPCVRGARHTGWKGNSVGYAALHEWVRKRLPIAYNCTKCKSPNRTLIRTDGRTAKYLHLANISGEYQRNIADWKFLCPPCHSKLDAGRNSISKVFVANNRSV